MSSPLVFLKEFSGLWLAEASNVPRHRLTSSPIHPRSHPDHTSRPDPRGLPDLAPSPPRCLPTGAPSPTRHRSFPSPPAPIASPLPLSRPISIKLYRFSSLPDWLLCARRCRSRSLHRSLPKVRRGIGPPHFALRFAPLPSRGRDRSHW
jgi:hypothetical protein